MSKVTFEQLVELAAMLRGPGGCPWDKEQTYETVAPMTIEEAYETLEAIEHQDVQALKHELGDLLFHVTFYAQIATERGEFTIDDVISYVYEKLVRRHPHVFADVTAETSAQVLHNWEMIKRAEKAANTADEVPSLLEGVSNKIPALLEAYQLTERASRVGFDWANAQQVLVKVDEELSELKQMMQAPEMDPDGINEEIGDLLFALVNLARKLRVDPELALRRANRKFKQRFRHIEIELHKRGRSLHECSLEEMDALWDEAKTARPNYSSGALQS